jgi:curved DNA-binding protein CbpA
MFEAINTAYETLSDPQLRTVFDKLKGVGQEDSAIKFSGPAFFEALGREALRRTAVLCVLYDRRITKPSTPSLSMRHLESVVESTSMELSSSIWYLKQRGLVASDDKSSMQITVDGMDFLESKRPNSAEVLPFIKDAALAEPRPVEQPPKSLPAAKPAQTLQAPQTIQQPRNSAEPSFAPEEESVLTTLNRALAKIGS